MEVIRGSGRSAYKLSQSERERERNLVSRGRGWRKRERESKSAVLVLSRDGSVRGQDYLLAVFGVQGENKLLLIFAVKCLSCRQIDCGQRIICFNMYPHSSYLFFSMSKAESIFDAAFLTYSRCQHSDPLCVCVEDEKWF